MLKKPAVGHRPWRVKRETGEKGAIRSSTFEVPKTSNFGPRTLARPARLSCGVFSHRSRRADHRSSGVPK